MRRVVFASVAVAAPLMFVALSGCGGDASPQGASTAATNRQAANIPSQLTCPVKGAERATYSVVNDTPHDLILTTDGMDCASWSGKWNPSFTNQRPNGAYVRAGKPFTIDLDRDSNTRNTDAIWAMHVADASNSPVGTVYANLRWETESVQYQVKDLRLSLSASRTFDAPLADLVTVGTVDGTEIQIATAGRRVGGMYVARLLVKK